jgi:hypothetical protein
MSDLIQAPFVRNQYAGINNPVYISDIVAANQQVLSALTAIAGLGATDFALFGGFQYVQAISGGNYYTPGFVYLYGFWYYQPNITYETQYLSPNLTGILPYTFSDSVSRNLYEVNYAKAVSVSTPGVTSPEMIGNMNGYRLDLKTINYNINTLITATTLQNIQIANFTGTQTLTFGNDQAIFYAASTGGSTVNINWNLTNAIPGTVVTLKWTFTSSSTLYIQGSASGTPTSSYYLESGTIPSGTTGTFIMYFIYVGLNASGINEVRYNISQV